MAAVRQQCGTAASRFSRKVTREGRYCCKAQGYSRPEIEKAVCNVVGRRCILHGGQVTLRRLLESGEPLLAGGLAGSRPKAEDNTRTRN